MKHLTDKELIENYQRTADSGCLDEIYRRYHQKVRRYCLAIIKDRETAEDLAQDTFVKVAKYLPTLKKPSTFVSWLFLIARNLCLDHLKKHSRTKAERIEETLDLADEIIDLEDLQAREHKIALMEILINELNPEDKTLLQLKYIEKAKIKDIQKQFGLTESAIKMRLARARKKVLRLYDQQLVKKAGENPGA